MGNFSQSCGDGPKSQLCTAAAGAKSSQDPNSACPWLTCSNWCSGAVGAADTGAQSEGSLLSPGHMGCVEALEGVLELPIRSACLPSQCQNLKISLPKQLMRDAKTGFRGSRRLYTQVRYLLLPLTLHGTLRELLQLKCWRASQPCIKIPSEEAGWTSGLRPTDKWLNIWLEDIWSSLQFGDSSGGGRGWAGGLWLHDFFCMLIDLMLFGSRDASAWAGVYER